MTLHREDYGFFAKSLYKLFRPTLARIVKSSKNDLDDTALEILDKLLLD